MKAQRIGLFLTLLALVTCGYASFNYQVDFVSRYIWRGFDLQPPHHPCVQPSITCTAGDSGFSASAWSSFCLEDRGVSGYGDEIDLTAIYTFKTPDFLSLYAGFTNYGFFFKQNFSFKTGTSQEFFASIGLPKALLAPSLALYYDINLGNGLYAQLKGSQTLAITQDIAPVFSAALGYNAHQFIQVSGLSDLTVNLTLPIKAGPLTIAPFITYAFVFLKEVNPDNQFLFGLSFIL